MPTLAAMGGESMPTNRSFALQAAIASVLAMDEDKRTLEQAMQVALSLNKRK